MFNSMIVCASYSIQHITLTKNLSAELHFETIYTCIYPLMIIFPSIIIGQVAFIFCPNLWFNSIPFDL